MFDLQSDECPTWVHGFIHLNCAYHFCNGGTENGMDFRRVSDPGIRTLISGCCIHVFNVTDVWHCFFVVPLYEFLAPPTLHYSPDIFVVHNFVFVNRDIQSLVLFRYCANIGQYCNAATLASQYRNNIGPILLYWPICRYWANIAPTNVCQHGSLLMKCRQNSSVHVRTCQVTAYTDGHYERRSLLTSSLPAALASSAATHWDKVAIRVH